jgi:hypothetical protein
LAFATLASSFRMFRQKCRKSIASCVASLIVNVTIRYDERL